MAGNVALKELDLSWNNIRQESAAAIGKALSLNKGLKSLILAHNAFNDGPSQELGDSLRNNDVLEVRIVMLNLIERTPICSRVMFGIVSPPWEPIPQAARLGVTSYRGIVGRDRVAKWGTRERSKEYPLDIPRRDDGGFTCDWVEASPRHIFPGGIHWAWTAAPYIIITLCIFLCGERSDRLCTTERSVYSLPLSSDRVHAID